MRTAMFSRKDYLNYLAMCIDLEAQKEFIDSMTQTFNRNKRSLATPPLPPPPKREAVAEPEYEKVTSSTRADPSHTLSTILFIGSGLLGVATLSTWENNISFLPFFLGIVALAGGIFARVTETKHIEEANRNAASARAAESSNQRKRDFYNSEVARADKRYAEQTARYKEAEKSHFKTALSNELQRQYLDNEISRLEAERRNVVSLLNALYSENVIKPVHRRLSHLSFLYNYLDASPKRHVSDGLDKLDDEIKHGQLLNSLNSINSTLNIISRSTGAIHRELEKTNRYMSMALAESRMIRGKLDNIAEQQSNLNSNISGGFQSLNSSLSGINANISSLNSTVTENKAMNQYYNDAMLKQMQYRNWISHRAGMYKNAGWWNVPPPIT